MYDGIDPLAPALRPLGVMLAVPLPCCCCHAYTPQPKPGQSPFAKPATAPKNCLPILKAGTLARDTDVAGEDVGQRAADAGRHRGGLEKPGG